MFKTKAKGWGIRSWDSINAGSFVCMYSGKLLSDLETEDLEDDMYTFDLDLQQTEAGVGGRHARGIGAAVEDDGAAAEGMSDTGAEFCVDSKHVGTVARFVNHSCNPNMFVQTVLFDHHDKRIPWVALFAAQNIAPLTELTYDYGYTGVVVDKADSLFKPKIQMVTVPRLLTCARAVCIAIKENISSFEI